MKKVITEDRSTTFYNKEVGDHYHTKAGARQEAFEKHVNALKIKDKNSPIIFDICFGVGYSTSAALDTIKKATIYCFENDKKILNKILTLNEDFKSYKIIKEFVKNFLKENKTIYEKNGIKLIMIYGDARKEIKNIKEKADFVFFAPFSPEKVPEMWTEEFFKNINKKMNKNGKLSTYAYAIKVRENFIKAGFKLEKGPILGRRSPSLIAIKQKL